ncbi:retrovirus-related pol polyprotein from transposon TNT 1-94 [Tanacetum coccineum]
MMNDSFHLASSDHPGMMLTTTPFNGGNFLGWSRTIKITLGAKFKLGFIDGSSPKPAIIHNDYQRWVRYDYMVTCWILNSMVAELSESFLYSQSASDLWKELEDHYGQSNGPLIYHVTHQVADPTSFFANNKGNQNVRKDNKSDGKSQGGDKKSCTFCNQDGHVYEQCFEKWGYPDWYKGKKNKKGNRMASQVVSDFSTYMTKDTPFDFEFENGVQDGKGDLDQRLVAADPSTKKVLAVGEGINNLYICKPSSGSSTKHPSIPMPTFPVMSSFVNKDVKTEDVTLDTFHARLGHTSVSKLIHVDSCKQQNVTQLSCDTCLLAKQHSLPFPISHTRSLVAFELIHVDLWGPYKAPALNGAHYFFTIVDDFSRCTWTYLLHTKDQVLSILSDFMAYIANHFKAKPKFLRSDNGTEIVNNDCLAYLRKQGIVHQRSMVYTPQQNAIVERKHRHLLDTARALKFHSGLPNKFWGDCVLTATYLINKMPMKILDWKTPFEMLHGMPPSYDHLRVIGVCCLHL